MTKIIDFPKKKNEQDRIPIEEIDQVLNILMAIRGECGPGGDVYFSLDDVDSICDVFRLDSIAIIEDDDGIYSVIGLLKNNGDSL